MYRLLLILFFCFAQFDLSYGQTIDQPKFDSTRSTDFLANNSFKDSAFLNQVGRDSVLAIVDSLLKDSSFIANSIVDIVDSLVNDSLPDSVEFFPSRYKIHFPLHPLGWTSDFEHIFSAAQISELDSIISNFEKETTNEIAIVTIDSSWTTKENFDNFVLDIHNKWGVGKKNINNGIVIGISTGLRIIRISNGYGIESKLTDAETKAIIDDTIIPEFRQGNYFEGTKKGLLAIMDKIR